MADTAWKKAWENIKKERDTVSDNTSATGGSADSQSKDTAWKKAWEKVKAERESVTSEDASWKEAWGEVKPVSEEERDQQIRDRALAVTQQKVLDSPEASQKLVDILATKEIKKQEQERKEQEAQKNREAIARLFGTEPDDDITVFVNKLTGGEESDFDSGTWYGQVLNNLGYGANKFFGGFNSTIAEWAGDAINIGNAVQRAFSTSDEINLSSAEDIKMLADYATAGGDVSSYESAKDGIYKIYGKKIYFGAYNKYITAKDQEQRQYELESNFDPSTVGLVTGGLSETIGAMVPGMVVGSYIDKALGIGTVASKGGILTQLPKDIKAGLGVKQIAKNTLSRMFQYNTTNLINATTAAGRAYTDWSMEYGDEPVKVYLNAVGNGLAEYLSENMFGSPTDAAKLGQYYDLDASSSFFKKVSKEWKALLGEMAEEGAEEIVNVPLQGLVNKATGDYDKQWVGWDNGAVFDLKEMLDSGAMGAMAGGVLGFVYSSANAISEAKGVRAQARAFNDYIDKLPEEIRPEHINVKSAKTSADVVMQATGKLYEMLAEICRIKGINVQVTEDGGLSFSIPGQNSATVQDNVNLPAIQQIIDDINTMTGHYPDIIYSDDYVDISDQIIDDEDISSPTSGADIATGNTTNNRIPSNEELREKQDSGGDSMSQVPATGLTQGSDIDTVVELVREYAGDGASLQDMMNVFVRTGMISDVNSLTQSEKDAIFAAWTQGNQDYTKSYKTHGKPSGGLHRGADIETVSTQAEKFGRAGATAQETMTELVRSGLVTDVNALTRAEGMSIANAWNRGNLDYKDAQKKKAGEASVRGNSEGAEVAGQTDATGQDVSGKPKTKKSRKTSTKKPVKTDTNGESKSETKTPSKKTNADVDTAEGTDKAEAQKVSKRKLKPSDDETTLDKMTRPAIAIYDRLTGAGLFIGDVELVNIDGLSRDIQETMLEKAFTVYPDGTDALTNMSDSAIVAIMLSDIGVRVKKDSAVAAKKGRKTTEKSPESATKKSTSTQSEKTDKPSEKKTNAKAEKPAEKEAKSVAADETGKDAVETGKRKLAAIPDADQQLGGAWKRIYDRLVDGGLSFEDVKLGDPPADYSKQEQETIVRALLNPDEEAGRAAHIETLGDGSITYTDNAVYVAARLGRLGVKLKLKSGSQYNISGNGSIRNQYAAKPKAETQSKETRSAEKPEAETPKEETPAADGEVAETEHNAVSMQDVIDKIQKDFGKQITLGYMRDLPKNVAGRYDTVDKGVRYRTANDVETVAHELGHALDDQYHILTKDTDLSVLKWYANTLSDERIAAYRKAYGLKRDGVDAYLPLAKEGLADRLADYLTDPEKTLKEYPKFKPYFINQLSKADRARLERTANMVHEAVTNDDALLRGTVHTIEKPKKTDDIIEGMRQAFKEGTPEERKEYRASAATYKVDSFITTFFNKNQRLKRLGQLSDSGSCEAFIDAQNATYNTGVVYSALMGNMTDLDGNVVGGGFHEILEGLTDAKGHLDPKLYHEFGLYLDIVHSAERQAQGHKIPQTMEKALENGTVERMEKAHPNFRELSEAVYAYNNRLLDIAVSYGLVDETVVKGWRDTYERYVPMQRYFDEQTRKSRGEARATMPKGFANINSPYKRAKGSQLDYYNPLDLIIQQTATVYQSAMHNRIMQSIVDLVADSPEPAILMERIPDDLHINKISTDELVERLTKKVKNNAEIEPEVADGMLQLLSDAIPEYLSRVETGTHTDASRRIVTVMENGQKVMYKVNDPELFKAIVNLNPTRDTPVVRLISAVSRGVVKMWTSLNPLFSVSNAARDLGTLTSSTLTEFGGEVAAGKGDRHISLKNRAALMGQMYKNIAKSYAQTVKERKKGLTATDPYHQEYIAMGGNESGLAGNAKFMSVDVREQFSKESSKRAFKERHGFLGTVRDGFAVFRYVSNMVERGPREAIYITAREMGIEPKLAYRLSQDTTTDFMNGGTLKGVSAFVPLFKAGTAGLYRAGRHWTGEHITSDYKIDPITSKSRQKRAVGRILASVILAISGALLQTVLGKADEDNYTQLSNYTKNNFYCIPVGNGMFATIPKPREWAALQSIFERAGEKVIFENDYALDGGDTWEYLTDMFLPNGISAIAQGDLMGTLGTIAGVGPLFEVGANKDYLGRDIVPQTLQDVSPKYQYNENTSFLAWALGQLEINLPLVGTLSPLQIDHIGRNWFGGLWEILKAHTEIGFFQDGDGFVGTLGKMATSTAIVDRWARDSAYSTDIINRMYDMRDAANIAKNDAETANGEKDNKAEMEYKWANNLSSFYSRYNKLAKTEPDSDQKRATRNTVLDMIESSMEAIDGKVTTATREKLEDYVKRTGDTSVMPAVMAAAPTYGKNNDKTLTLTADQYVEFQTLYNTYYWQYVEQFFNNPYSGKLGDTSVKKNLSRARERALNRAKSEMVTKVTKGE